MVAGIGVGGLFAGTPGTVEVSRGVGAGDICGGGGGASGDISGIDSSGAGVDGAAGFFFRGALDFLGLGGPVLAFF